MPGRSAQQQDAPLFDLQSHSTCSDGALPPAGVVALAARAGVELLALTDHDTVAGVGDALQAARSIAGLVLVPATELSAVSDGYEDLHVLGYRVDHRDSSLLEALESFRADRVRRADAMGEALRELGFALDDSALERRRAQGLPVGRPHLAKAAFDDPANARRLAGEGLESPSALLAAYLIPGRPAYRPRSFPTVEQAIELIHAAGGVAVWAHPFWDIASVAQVRAAIARFAAAGLDGVEAFYPTHTFEQARAIAAECERLDLLTTGSADFHGPDHPHFSRFRAFELHDLEPRLGPLGLPASSGGHSV